MARGDRFQLRILRVGCHVLPAAAEIGIVQNLGGGSNSSSTFDCGTVAKVNCALVGNSGFAHVVDNAAPFANAYLIVTLSTLGGQPNLYRGFVVATTTDVCGNASVPMPLPNCRQDAPTMPWRTMGSVS